jgi:hypothetical protein
MRGARTVPPATQFPLTPPAPGARGQSPGYFGPQQISGVCWSRKALGEDAFGSVRAYLSPVMGSGALWRVWRLRRPGKSWRIAEKRRRTAGPGRVRLSAGGPNDVPRGAGGQQNLFLNACVARYGLTGSTAPALGRSLPQGRCLVTADAISIGGVDLVDPGTYESGVPYDAFRELRLRAPVAWHP